MAATSVVEDIVVCCDGTWCGNRTETTGNIKIIADSFADKQLCPSKNSGEYVFYHYNVETHTHVGYFEGAGVNVRNFDEYIINGAVTLDIMERCVEAYRFIVDYYKCGTKIWLFGHSRGAFTVRSIAGMISLCGILRRSRTNGQVLTDKELKIACEEVYSIYRRQGMESDTNYKESDPKDKGSDPVGKLLLYELSNSEMYKPEVLYNPKANSNFWKCFREKLSYTYVEPPIRFMGLFDSVGALGVPKIGAGTKLTYEPYHEPIPEEVETVVQGLCVHDRVSNLVPYHVWRDFCIEDPEKYKNTCYEKPLEVWFPGSHIDIGRQRFVPLRIRLVYDDKKVGLLEHVGHYFFKYTNFGGLNIDYDEELSNPPLLWLLQQAKKAKSSLLPKSADCYLLDYARDKRPRWWDWYPFRPFRGPNAVDELKKRWFQNLGLRILSSWLSILTFGTVNLLLGIVKFLLDNQVLGDRHIPLHLDDSKQRDGRQVVCGEEQMFYGTPEDYIDNDYESKSFQRFVIMGGNPIYG